MKSKQKCDVGILPWVGCEDEENVKQQILSLSAVSIKFCIGQAMLVEISWLYFSMTL